MKKNTSSFHVIKDGRMIHGNAAFLHLASKKGGIDGFLKQYGNELMKNTLNAFLLESNEQPKLSIVK